MITSTTNGIMSSLLLSSSSYIPFRKDVQIFFRIGNRTHMLSQRFATKHARSEGKSTQQKAYEYYCKQGRISDDGRQRSSVDELNIKIASYAAAVVIGALGATYASVPLYKIFCQATGFGGTTVRVMHVCIFCIFEVRCSFVRSSDYAHGSLFLLVS